MILFSEDRDEDDDEGGQRRNWNPNAQIYYVIIIIVTFNIIICSLNMSNKSSCSLSNFFFVLPL